MGVWKLNIKTCEGKNYAEEITFTDAVQNQM